MFAKANGLAGDNEIMSLENFMSHFRELRCFFLFGGEGGWLLDTLHFCIAILFRADTVVYCVFS